jgi:hypothetical protein
MKHFTAVILGSASSNAASTPASQFPLHCMECLLNYRVLPVHSSFLTDAGSIHALYDAVDFDRRAAPNL